MRIPSAIQVQAEYVMHIAEMTDRMADAEVYAALRAYTEVLAERLKAQAERDGARAWVNEWVAELTPADVPVPCTPIKYIVPGRRWPQAQPGTTIEIDGVLHKVVVNTSTGRTGHQCQFGIYIVKPA